MMSAVVKLQYYDKLDYSGSTKIRIQKAFKARKEGVGMEKQRKR